MPMQENLRSFSKIDIVCFSLSRWDAPISSPAVSLAKEFSKTNRVFYIEHPYSWKDLINERKIPGKAPYRDDSVIVITPPLVWPINFLPEGAVYNRLSAINNSIVLKTMRVLLNEMDIKRFLFINFFDPFFLRKLPKDIKPIKFIYQCMDDMSQVDYTRRHGVRLEEEIIRNADITLCTSRELTRMKSAVAPNVYFHPNAADVELFKSAFGKTLPRPLDIEFGEKKIIGFMGSIEYRTDFELLRKMAVFHHDKILYLLGPVAGEEHIKAGLTELPNVIFAGSRSIEELPEYLQHFDCCIIPYKINTLTRSIYPLKINEYLAAGKPVVCTNFSEDINSFKEVAYIADTHDEFIAAIDKAINEDNQNKKYQRLDVASSNSWQNRVEGFWKIVNIKEASTV
jgi:glycosyltransferase involved in cell wall biosynthesis